MLQKVPFDIQVMEAAMISESYCLQEVKCQLTVPLHATGT